MEDIKIEEGGNRRERRRLAHFERGRVQNEKKGRMIQQKAQEAQDRRLSVKHKNDVARQKALDRATKKENLLTKDENNGETLK